MSVASRTPEGFPTSCVVCGASHPLEFSEPADDAPCLSCGCLLWRSARRLSSLKQRFNGTDGNAAREISPDLLLVDLAADSLDMIELVMELEKELAIAIPFHEAERMQTLGDVLRYAERHSQQRA